MKLFTRVSAAAILSAGLLSADVTYSQDTKFQGGTMVDMMNKMASMPMMGRLGGNNMKQAFEDQHFDVYVKGNKMARWGKISSTIYDLDAGTITTIDNKKQTYSTVTFEEMQQRLEQAQQRMSKAQGGDIEFDVKSSSTGQTKVIDGETARETLIVMTAKQASAQGQMVVTMHAWLVPFKPAMKELRDFQEKLSAKFAYGIAGSQGLGAAAKGLTAAAKEAMKQDGYPVETEVAISGVSAAAGNPMAAFGGGGNADPNAPLLKTLSDSTGFAVGGVDDAKFAVPAGFKAVQQSPR